LRGGNKKEKTRRSNGAIIKRGRKARLPPLREGKRKLTRLLAFCTGRWSKEGLFRTKEKKGGGATLHLAQRKEERREPLSFRPRRVPAQHMKPRGDDNYLSRILHYKGKRRAALAIPA